MSRSPNILVLHGENVGDRNQAETLAKLMGWPYRMERLQPPRRPRMPKITGAEPDAVIVVTMQGTRMALRMNKQLSRPMKIIKLGVADDIESADLNIVSGKDWKPPHGKTVYQQLPFSMVDQDKLNRARSDFPATANAPAAAHCCLDRRHKSLLPVGC